MTDADPPPRQRFWSMLTGARLAFLIPCALIAIAIAFVPLSGLRALGRPLWLAIVAALVIFPLLPLAWHVLAERRYGGSAVTPQAVLFRLAARALGVALFALAVTLCTLGPHRLRANVMHLLRGRVEAPQITAAPRAAPATPRPVDRNQLEAFIPADATLVVSLSGSAAMQQLLTAHGVDTRERLAAFAKCKIDTEHARVLIAARGGGPQMIVVRAPGIADERSLYCLIGVLGNDRLQIRFLAKEPPARFEVSGLLGRSLTFHALDGETIGATDESWGDSTQKLFPAGGDIAEGRLASVLERLDRTATIWSASLTDTADGTWDLALDARAEGKELKLRGSSIPPSGAADRAELVLRVPLTFAAALPEGALAQGLRGVVMAVMATGASLRASPDAGRRD
jgi:hypothetical protein